MMSLTPLPQTTPPTTVESSPEFEKVAMGDQHEHKVMDPFRPYQ
jgi:hypothetical protein